MKKMSYDDRLCIAKMLKEGYPITEIAKEIGVHRVSIYTELKRGGSSCKKEDGYKGYNPDVAQFNIFSGGGKL